MIVWEQMCFYCWSLINKYSQTHGWISPTSRALSSDLIYRSPSAAAVTASSLAGERISRGRLAFVNAVGVNAACLIGSLLQ